MVRLPNLLAFEVLARHLSFARAAEELEVTPTAMSKTIKQLESDLGVRLFNRTTRSVALTEQGARMIGELVPALAQIKSSVTRASELSGRPSGLLRINTSYVAYAALIEPHMRSFLERYRDIALDVQIDNGLSDIVGGGFDVGIRLGHALQRDMIAVPLGPVQQLVVVGAPKYLAKHGAPEAPKDLLGHACIRQRLAPGRALEWSFVVGTKTITLDVTARLVLNEMHSVVTAAVDGCGLAYVFKQFAAPHLRAKQLVPLLERFTRPREAFHAYYPSRAQLPGKLKAFLEHIRAVNWTAPS